jgi:glycolate oxidase iron-sulfur subunit
MATVPIAGSNASLKLAQLADRCVMCGLCLPHCPSYRVAREEGESPRGRIAFARSLARSGPAAATSRLREQLDDCLACGSCSDVCPAGVDYGAILDRLRTVASVRRDTLQRRLLRAVARRPMLLRVLLRVARAAQRWGVSAQLPPTWRRLGAFAAAAPPTRAKRGSRPANSGPRRVIAFRSCVSAVLEDSVWDAAARVLGNAGYGLETARKPSCCGALERHAGFEAEAAKLAAESHAHIAACGASQVIHIASGCHADLAALAERAPQPLLISELTQFLARDAAITQLPNRPSTQHVALHVPCTQQAIDGGAAARSVLERIPGLRLSVLPLQPRCCGGAGLYFVDHAAIADALLSERVTQIRTLAPDVVLTTNIGCKLQLRAGLLAAGVDIPIQHPVEVLAQSLRS